VTLRASTISEYGRWVKVKEDQSESLEERRLENLVKEHFELIGFPIELYVESYLGMEKYLGDFGVDPSW